MKYNPDIHHRRSIRLKNYDYSQQSAYFITICTHNRQNLFGEIVDGAMILNEYGKIAQQCWLEIPVHFPHVRLDEFVIMPNHVHGIIIITDDIGENNGLSDIVGAKNFSPLQIPKHISPLQIPKFQSPKRTIGSIIRGFKIGVTKWFRQNTDIYNVWQRNYTACPDAIGEHIIRNDDELNRIRQYIINNPLQWESDENNLIRVGYVGADGRPPRRIKQKTHDL
jgi:REP element-mobilizing transposase RayT